MRLGLREANQKFSKAVKAVKAGKEVVLTERGKPIAKVEAGSHKRKALIADHQRRARRAVTFAYKVSKHRFAQPR